LVKRPLGVLFVEVSWFVPIAVVVFGIPDPITKFDGVMVKGPIIEEAFIES